MTTTNQTAGPPAVATQPPGAQLQPSTATAVGPAKPPRVSAVAAVQSQPPGPPLTAVEAIEHALVGDDLGKLDALQRVEYVQRVCESLGLNHLTGPFAYITFQGKTKLYAKRDCADQLRRLHSVTVEIAGRDILDDCLVVHVRATMPAGGKGAAKRSDEDIGVVSLAGLKGEPRANAMMKAITKAKRRVTLSICGLGFLDETEVAQPETVQVQSVQAQPLPLPLPAPANPGTATPAPISTPIATAPPSVPSTTTPALSPPTAPKTAQGQIDAAPPTGLASLPSPPASTCVRQDQVDEMVRLRKELGYTTEQWRALIADAGGVTTAWNLLAEQADQVILQLRHQVSTTQLEQGAQETAAHYAKHGQQVSVPPAAPVHHAQTAHAPVIISTPAIGTPKGVPAQQGAGFPPASHSQQNGQPIANGQPRGQGGNGARPA